MKRHKIPILSLIVLLLCGLAACHQKGPPAELLPEDRPLTGEPYKIQVEPIEETSEEPDEEPEPEPEPDPEPEPEPEPDGTWDLEHKLNVEFSPVPDGTLEVPVIGATGYTTVTLSLWKERPEYTDPTRDSDATPLSATLVGVEERSGEPEEIITSSEPELAATNPEEEPEREPEPMPELELEPEPDPEPTPEAEPEPEPEALPELQPNPSSSAAPVPTPTPKPAPKSPTIRESKPSPLAVLRPGTAFTILDEVEDWWLVQTQEVTGWVEHTYCLINLPDVIPSMLYQNTNADSSRFVSSGKAIPSITGEMLYSSRAYNPRLGREEYLMPVLYATAKHICQAQQAALADGNTLVLYEGYRPYETQRAVFNALSQLSSRDAEVRAGIARSPWNISWFIAANRSNHQRGFAIDVSLAKVIRAEIGELGGYPYVNPMQWIEYDMPTQVHELSRAAATFTAPVEPLSDTEWMRATLSDAVRGNSPALALQHYCTVYGGLTPLPSEWWHFNDLEVREQISGNQSSGDYFITECRSLLPEEARAIPRT